MAFLDDIGGWLSGLYRRLPFSDAPEPKKRADIAQPPKVGFMGSTQAPDIRAAVYQGSPQAYVNPYPEPTPTPTTAAPEEQFLMGDALSRYTDMPIEEIDRRMKSVGSHFAATYGIPAPDSIVLSVATNPGIKEGAIPTLFSPATVDALKAAMGGFVDFGKRMIEPWEKTSFRAQEIVNPFGISEGPWEPGQRAPSLVREGGYSAEEMRDPASIMIDTGEVALDLFGGGLLKAGGKLGQISRGGAKAGIAGAGVISAADLVDQANRGELGPEDTAQALLAAVGTYITADEAVKLAGRVANTKVGQIVGAKLAEETGSANLPGVPQGFGKNRRLPKNPLWRQTLDKAKKENKAVSFDDLVKAIDEDYKIEPEIEIKSLRKAEVTRTQPEPGTLYSEPAAPPLRGQTEVARRHRTETGFEFWHENTLGVREKSLKAQIQQAIKTKDQKTVERAVDELGRLRQEVSWRKQPDYSPPLAKNNDNLAPELEIIEGKPSWLETAKRGAFRSITDTLRKMGDPGERLATLMDTVRETSEMSAAKALSQAQRQLKPLNQTEVTAVVRYLDEGLSPNSYETLQAALGVRSILDRVAKEAGESLPEFTRRTNYFPHIFRIQDLKVGGKLRQKAAQKLVDTGAATDIADAHYLLDAKITAAGRRYGNIDFQRLGNLEGWERDPLRALPEYFHKAFRRIEEAKAFGSKDEQAKAIIGEIYKVSGSEDAQWARQAFEIAVGRDPRVTDQATTGFMRGIRAFNTMTLMHLSAIANSFQKVNVALVGKIGVRDFVKGIRQYRSTEGIEFAKRTGALSEQTMREMMSAVGGEGLASRYLGLVRFKAAEANNRIFAANVGRNYAQRMAAKLQSGGRSGRLAARALAELGLDPNKLPDNYLELAAKRISDKTQFRADPSDLPMWWSSEGGKVVTQLKHFALNQAKFLKRGIYDEAKKGNFRPLLVFATLYPLAGEGVADIHAAIKSKERPPVFPEDSSLESIIEGPVSRYLENIAWVGGLGLLTDIYNSMQYGAAGVAGLVGGPSVGGIVETGAAVGEVMQGEPPTQLVRAGAGRLPIAGPVLRGRIAENRGQIQMVSSADRRALLKIQERSQKRTKLSKQISRLAEQGDLEAAEALGEKDGISITAGDLERKKREKIFSAVTNRLEDIPDTDKFKRDQIYESYPEVGGVWDYAVISEQAYDEWGEKYKKERGVKSIAPKDALMRRREWREKVGQPMLKELVAAQTDQAAAQAWVAFAQAWDARNQYLEREEMSPNSPDFKKDRVAFEQYITGLMQYSRIFADQYAIMPPDLFRR